MPLAKDIHPIQTTLHASVSAAARNRELADLASDLISISDLKPLHLRRGSKHPKGPAPSLMCNCQIYFETHPFRWIIIFGGESYRTNLVDIVIDQQAAILRAHQEAVAPPERPHLPCNPPRGSFNKVTEDADGSFSTLTPLTANGLKKSFRHAAPCTRCLIEKRRNAFPMPRGVPAARCGRGELRPGSDPPRPASPRRSRLSLKLLRTCSAPRVGPSSYPWPGRTALFTVPRRQGEALFKAMTFDTAVSICPRARSPHDSSQIMDSNG